MWFADAPNQKGQAMNTDFWMRLYNVCGGGGDLVVPVRIKWL